MTSDSSGSNELDGSHPVINRLLRGGAPPARRIQAFLKENTFPLIAPKLACFAWYGPAEQVHILRWIHAGIDRSEFRRVDGTDLWLLCLSVENEGRFEYKLGIIVNGHEDWVRDPLNPDRAGDPFGENSVCRTWGYQRPSWSAPQGAPAGRLETLKVDSETFDQRREEGVYLPAGFDADGESSARYPLLIVHDGHDFVTYADLAVSLDNLVANGDIPPLIAVLVQSNNRMLEYPRGRRHSRYLVQELLPAIEAVYPISRRAHDRVLLGASLGAVASLATAFRYPGVFGGLVLNSGSFIFDTEELDKRPHPVFKRTARLAQALKRAPALPATRAFVSTGELEGLADQNRELASFLAGQGVEVYFKSAWDGHHWHNWRDQIRDALMWVFARHRPPRP